MNDGKLESGKLEGRVQMDDKSLVLKISGKDWAVAENAAEFASKIPIGNDVIFKTEGGKIVYVSKSKFPPKKPTPIKTPVLPTQLPKPSEQPERAPEQLEQRAVAAVAIEKALMEVAKPKIIVGREETRQMGEYQPLKLTATLVIPINSGAEASEQIWLVQEMLRETLFEQFEREATLRLEGRGKK